MTYLRIFSLILTFATITLQSYAQTYSETDNLQADIPFIVDKISVSQETDFTVTITGEVGAVNPSTQIAVQNLYTNDTKVVMAESDGSFVATVFGLEGIPYVVADGTGVWEAMGALYDLNKSRTIIYPDFDSEQDISFGLAGWVSYGWLRWLADSTINSLNFDNGHSLSVSMDVTFYEQHGVLFQNPLWIPDYEVQGRLSLRRITDETGRQLLPQVDNSGSYVTWGWISEMTESGLPIHGQNSSDILITTTQTTILDIDSDNNPIFTLNFETTLDDLPTGLYIPVFEGDFKVAGKEFNCWYCNKHFAVDGTDGITHQVTVKPYPIVMPFLISIGEVKAGE